MNTIPSLKSASSSKTLTVLSLLFATFVVACSSQAPNSEAKAAASAADIDPTSDPVVQPVGATAPEGHSFKLSFSDEFNGTAIDESKWYYRSGSKNVSTMLPENNRVEDGIYHIDLKKEKVGETNYTCGGIISHKFVRYGYYETSMKIPATGGRHASFWMMNETDFPRLKLDPFENDSVHQDRYTVDAHYWNA